MGGTGGGVFGAEVWERAGCGGASGEGGRTEEEWGRAEEKAGQLRGGGGADRDGAWAPGNPWRVGEASSVAEARQCPFESLALGVQSAPQQSARVKVEATQGP